MSSTIGLAAPPVPPQAAPSAGGGEAGRSPSARTASGLDWVNFFLADVQTGVGPFLAVYLIGVGHGWNKQSAGWALTVGGLAGIAAQTPAGALVDRVRAKRTLIAVGVACLAVGAVAIAAVPRFWPVLFAQALIGSTSSVFVPAIAAVSLGLVGTAAFDHRQGRNQTFNSAGNAVAAVAIGAIGYFLPDRFVFLFVAAMVVPTLLCLRRIDPGEIDYELARGCKPGDAGGRSGSVVELLGDRRLVLFLAAAVGFHFANAAMLPLLGEMLGSGRDPRYAMPFMTGCIVTTQLVVTVLAGPIGRLASTWGRKPLLTIGFAVLPVRGVLYTLAHHPALLIAIQLLDGVAAVAFGVCSVLVVADLTRGTGRFNLAQGAIATAVGIGAALSQVVAGSIAQQAGDRAAFLFLAAVAAAALVLFWLAVPETKDADGRQPRRGHQPRRDDQPHGEPQ